jgi:hypothetical protein
VTVGVRFTLDELAVVASTLQEKAGYVRLLADDSAQGVGAEAQDYATAAYARVGILESARAKLDAAIDSRARKVS